MRKFAFLTILFIAAFTRLFFLSSLPPSLYQDETAIGYNAYSILKTGRDEWGKPFPVYFKSFGDYKMPLYIYTVALFEKFLGLSELAVRLPSAIAGIAAVGLLYLTVMLLTKNETLSLISSFLLAINPQHIFFSRAGFEVNFSLALILAGAYFFLLFTKRSRSLFLFISLLFFTTAVYTYNIARLASPATLIVLSLVYKDKLFKAKRSLRIFSILFLLLLLTPILLASLKLKGQTVGREFILSSPYVKAQNVKERAYFLERLPGGFVKLFFNHWAFAAFLYLKNLASIFDFNFFFVKGSTHPNQGIGNIGVFHLFEAPFILLGFSLALSKGKELANKIFLGLFLAFYLILALSRTVPHATRGFYLVLPLVYFEALGWSLLFEHLKKLSKAKRIAILGVIFSFVLYNLLYFTLSYTLIFPKEKAKAWGVAQKQLALFLKENYDRYEEIFIDKKVDFAYTTLAFYLKLEPEKFQRTVKYERSGDLYKAVTFDKIRVKNVNLDEDLKPKTLVVLDGLAQPPEKYVVKTIKLPKRHIALSLQDNITQWPEEKTMFVLVGFKN